jgi:hypothetical protein
MERARILPVEDESIVAKDLAQRLQSMGRGREHARCRRTLFVEVEKREPCFSLPLSTDCSCSRSHHLPRQSALICAVGK